MRQSHSAHFVYIFCWFDCLLVSFDNEMNAFHLNIMVLLCDADNDRIASAPAQQCGCWIVKLINSIDRRYKYAENCVNHKHTMKTSWSYLKISVYMFYFVFSQSSISFLTERGPILSDKIHRLSFWTQTFQYRIHLPAI